MKLLLNDKEIANFLLSLIDLDHMMINNGHIMKFENVENLLYELHPKMLNEKSHSRLFSKIQKSLKEDLNIYRSSYLENRIEYAEKYFSIIHKNIDLFIDKFGEDFIFESYKKGNYTNFIKGVGSHLTEDLDFIRRKKFNNYDEECLIRNTVGNEELLVTKIDRGLPFWFIDSGYTNFLEFNKKWHRLVKNHLHYGNSFPAPVDRLGNFKSFPKQWRNDGEFILVIEPGHFAAEIFKVDLSTWKYNVEKELSKYTNKKIKFREKAPKKERTPLYKELLEEDYYCLININSNAATEAIWAGIPVITLDQHISNPVSRNKLSEINNLYRGSLAEWLCMLSYSQFTKDELIDGTAKKIVDGYHYA